MMRLAQAVVSFVRSNKRLAPAFVVIAALAALLLWRAAHSYHIAALEEMASKSEQYSSLRSMNNRSDELEAMDGSYAERLGALEAGLIDADRPATGAARLQEAFTALASKRRVDLVSQRALAAIPADYYVKVPVEFRIRTDLAELKELLFELRSSPVLMGVSYMRVKVPEQGASLDVTLVVVGAIRKTGV